MSKLLGMINKLDTKELDEYLDGYIFGLKDLSVNFLNTFTLDELKNKKIDLEKQNKEMYIVINKNMDNSDIDELKKIINEIEQLNLNGIFYADNSFITLKEEFNIKTDLIWYQEHLTTSYAGINTYKEFGIKGAVISNDITFNEVKEILEKTSDKLFYMVFGYLPMFVSKRNQVKNYQNYFKLDGITEYNYFINENNKYPIIDNENGTSAFSEKPICAYEEYLEIKDKLTYAIFSDLFINEEDYVKIVKKFKEENNDEIKLETSSNFLYKDTIYKIK